MFLLRKITGSGTQADCRTRTVHISVMNAWTSVQQIIEEEFEDEEISGRGNGRFRRNQPD